MKFVAVSDPHDDATRTVFFELNRQPRSVRVRDRSKVAQRPVQRKAEPGNVGHVGAPMPGTITTIAVKTGQKVSRGETLLALEAMKMEAAVRAEVDGSISEVLVKPGMQVDAKDLLVVISS